MSEEPAHHDCIVIGAGFSGLAVLHHLRAAGFDAVGVDRNDAVGGTWLVNRYPGVRTDSDFPIYSFSFPVAVREEWTWSEQYPTGAEVLAYLQFLANRLGLIDHIQFGREVVRAEYSEHAGLWRVDFASGPSMTCTYLVSCMGILDAPMWPDIPGRDTFAGELLHTADWPVPGVELAGRTVGLIGLGSSGIQIMPLLARDSAALYVFQREPNYVVESSFPAVSAEQMAHIRRTYDDIWRRAAAHPFGVDMVIPEFGADEVSAERRRLIFESKWQEGGHHFANETFHDLATDPRASEHAAEFIRSKIRQIVHDPATAELLSPRRYSFNGKRVPTGHGYYAAYNLPHVHLVDVRTTPIDEVVPAGLRVGARTYPCDVLVCATGFDAMTGPLTRIDIVGRDGRVLREAWRTGVRTNLGLSVHGFPNLLLSLGPQTPYSNLPVPIQLGAQWMARALTFARDHQIVLEATAQSEQWWAEEVERTGRATVMYEEGAKAGAWFLGANVPGKRRELLVYMGGGQVYQQHCMQAELEQYRSFRAQG